MARAVLEWVNAPRMWNQIVKQKLFEQSKGRNEIRPNAKIETPKPNTTAVDEIGVLDVSLKTIPLSHIPGAADRWKAENAIVLVDTCAL